MDLFAGAKKICDTKKKSSNNKMNNNKAPAAFLLSSSSSCIGLLLRRSGRKTSAPRACQPWEARASAQRASRMVTLARRCTSAPTWHSPLKCVCSAHVQRLCSKKQDDVFGGRPPPHRW